MITAAQRKLWENTIAATKTKILLLTGDSENWRELGHIRAINPHRVLASAWNPRRLDDCRRRLAKGETPSRPIEVARYWWWGEAWYTVSDGNHRATAACEAGRNRIRACINMEAWSSIEGIYVRPDAQQVYRKVSGTWYKQIGWSVDPEEIRLLLAFGAKELPVPIFTTR